MPVGLAFQRLLLEFGIAGGDGGGEVGVIEDGGLGLGLAAGAGLASEVGVVGRLFFGLISFEDWLMDLHLFVGMRGCHGQ